MSYDMDRIRHVGGMTDTSFGAMSKLTFTTKVMPLFGLALLAAAAGTYLGTGLPMAVLWGAFGIELVLAFTAGIWQRKEGLNQLLFFVYALLSGVTLVPLLTYVAHMPGGVTLVTQALVVSTVTFFGCAAFGFTTKRDLSGLGGFMVMAMLGLLAAGLLNVFVFQSGMLSLACSIAGVGIFSAFTVYEMAMIRTSYSDQDYVGASLGLFIAFMGLFTSILRLFGLMGGSSDD